MAMNFGIGIGFCPKNWMFHDVPVPIESPVTNGGVQHSWKSSINAYLAIARRDYQKVDHFEPHPRIKIITGFSMLLKFGEAEKAQAHAPRSIFGNMATSNHFLLIISKVGK